MMILYVVLVVLALGVVAAQAVVLRLILHPILLQMEQTTRLARLTAESAQLQLDHLLAGQRSIRDQAAGVAVALSDSQHRADQVVAGAPGAAADAGAQS